LPRDPWAAARLSSADGSAISCAGGRQRKLTSRSSACPKIVCPELLAPFGRVEPIGNSFPVYKVVDKTEGIQIDVTLPRRESKSGRGHKGFIVHGDPTMSIAEAARRETSR
jgi:hypothetical protein